MACHHMNSIVYYCISIFVFTALYLSRETDKVLNVYSTWFIQYTPRWLPEAEHDSSFYNRVLCTRNENDRLDFYTTAWL